MAKFNITLHVNLEVDDKYLEQWNRGQERFAKLYSKCGDNGEVSYTSFADVTAQDYCDHIDNLIYENGETGTVTYEIN